MPLLCLRRRLLVRALLTTVGTVLAAGLVLAQAAPKTWHLRAGVHALRSLAQTPGGEPRTTTPVAGFYTAGNGAGAHLSLAYRP